MAPSTIAPTGTINALAPAKVNLCLHVTGRRPDGYHLLETLVVFSDQSAADRVSAEHSGRNRLVVEGPYADELDEADDNLVLRARDWLQARRQSAAPVAIRLEKHLPIASGLGGGSADAAATLRLLSRLWGAPDALTPDAREAICAELGADIAMCIESRTLIARGIGEDLTLIDDLPSLPAVIINPGVPLSTPAVFGGLEERTNPPMPPLPKADLQRPEALARWLAAETRNDLEAPAKRIAPVIDLVLNTLTDAGALMARMSGSGATCFGLFDTANAAHTAAGALAGRHKEWWVLAAMLNPRSDLPPSAEGAFRVTP